MHCNIAVSVQACPYVHKLTSIALQHLLALSVRCHRGPQHELLWLSLSYIHSSHQHNQPETAACGGVDHTLLVPDLTSAMLQTGVAL